MKNNYFLFLVISLFFGINQLRAQTTIINPTAEGGFELGTTFAANGWTVVNTTTTPYNAWWVGNVPTAFGTGNSAYISSDIAGATHLYSTAQGNQVHFYRDVTFPAGEDFIVLQFQVIVNGENNWDMLQVSLAPTTVTPTAATTYPGSGTGPIVPGSTVLGNYTMLGTGVQTITVIIPAALVGNCSNPSTMRLIFSWKSDATVGTQPPAAVDNISLVSSSISPSPTLSVFTIDNTMATGGTNFNNFNDAIAWLNVVAASCAGINNPITFNVMSGQTFTETPKIINATGTPANTITFQKSGTAANPIILATNGVGTIDAAITINGGDYITFNGIDINDNPANVTTTTQIEYGFLIKNASDTNGAQNNTVTNSTIILNRTNTASRGILQTASTTAGGFIPTNISGSNANNTYTNIVIENAYAGIYLLGNATYPDLNCQIANSTIGSAMMNDIGGGTLQTWGIRAQNQNSVTINNNLIRNVSASGAIVDGIFLELGQGVSTISNNRVLVLRNLSTTSAASVVSGIKASLSATGTNESRIFNNFVSEILSNYTGTAVATRTLRGINILTGGAATSRHNVQFNSVRIDGSGSPNLSSTCFEIGTTSGPIMDIRNNIFANFTGAQSGVSKHYTWVSTSATLIGNTGSVSDYNDLYIANTTNGFVGLGNTTDRATLADWQTATSNDANSVTTDPLFVSNFDLHASALGTHNAGTMTGITWVSTDIDGETRSMSTPDIGADEYMLSVCTSANGGTINPSTYTVCEGQTVTLTSVGATSDVGISYQWMFSTTSGGPYTNVTGGSGANTTSYITAPLSPGTYYYVLQVTCTPASLTALSNEVTVVVNPLPVVAVNPTSATYCNPSTPITLTATGASTYSWSPATGLSATTGSTVDASPTTTTNYTVTGTDVNGCVNTAVSTITVINNPVITGVTATPQNLCSGDTSQLQANAYSIQTTTVDNYQFSNSTGATLHTFTAPTTAVNSNVDDTPSSVQNIGFTFKFENADYTQFSVSPDGWIRLGGTAATNQFTNSVISTVNIPKIYPYWDDLATGSTGNVVYEVIGTAPNRILIVQWFVTIPRNLSGPANSTFQAWLYESNGLIEFRYGNMNTATMSASVGATGLSTAPVHYQSITISSNTTSNSVPNNNNTGQPAAGTMYSLFPISNPVTYTWTPATFLNATNIANPLAEAVTATTTYTVTAMSGSCTSTPANITINVDPLNLSTSVTPADTVCEGTNITLQTTVTGGGQPYSYSWTGPNGFTSTDANPLITAITPLGTGTYYVTLNDNCSTILSDSIVLTVNANPTVAVTSTDTNYCNPGTPVTLTATGALTYSWSPATGLSATSGDMVDASPTSTTLYTVVGTDVNGCQGNATININVFNTPVATPTATPAVICEGDTTQLQANAFAGTAYCTPTVGITGATGDFIDGVVFADISNLNSGDAPTDYTYYNALTANVVADNTTLYTLSLTPTTSWSQQFRVWIDFNHNGVFEAAESVYNTTTATTTTVTTSITIPNTAYNGITRMRVACRFSSQVLATEACGHTGFGEYEDYNVSITGGQDQFSFVWTPSSTLNFDNISNPMAYPTSTETYQVTILDTISGCSSNASVVVTVNPAPVDNLGADTLLCGITSITLDAGNAGSTYLWSDSTTNQTLNVTANGNYSVEITEPVNGCTATYDINVSFGQLPAPVNLGNDTVVCNGGSLVLDAGSGYTSYNWITGDTTQTITASTAGTYSVTVTNADGCEAADTILITLGSNPTVNLGPDTTICIYNSITLDAGPGFTSYTWSNAATTQTIVVLGSQGLGLYTYSVGVTDAFGCVGRDTIRITVDECLGVNEINGQSVNVMPNPNNGNFVINLDNIANADIKIFDMQGKLIYNSRLNGTINRKEITIEKAERGVYMLQITSADRIYNQRIIVNY
jgi:hypothetical protein